MFLNMSLFLNMNLRCFWICPFHEGQQPVVLHEGHIFESFCCFSLHFRLLITLQIQIVSLVVLIAKPKKGLVLVLLVSVNCRFLGDFKLV